MLEFGDRKYAYGYVNTTDFTLFLAVLKNGKFITFNNLSVISFL